LKGKTALILGCGYVGVVLARALRERGVNVVGTTRNPDRFPEIEASGATPALADVMDPAGLRPLAAASPDLVVDLVRPQRIDRDRYTSWGTRNVVTTFAAARPEAMIYVSSTSVYGRRNGEFTDETTEIAPSSPVGVARADAERIYLETFATAGAPIRICRVPGIYGPGRTLRQRLESGAYRRIDGEELWVSRIHVDDLATGIIAAWTDGAPGEIYLLSDDEPTTAEAYAELTADLLSLPMPPTVNRDDLRLELGRDAFERRIASRRCSNRRMREELGVELKYPTIRQGLPAALLAEAES
jgi:nucleoside-diphosphate-sugar epimerase